VRKIAKKKTEFTESEKNLVEYLKEKLAARGIKKFPRDWHLRQLSTARLMLAGENAPSLDEWKDCIDWLFSHEYWGDKVDHLARVEGLWTKYVLQGNKSVENANIRAEKEKKKAFIKSLYI